MMRGKGGVEGEIGRFRRRPSQAPRSRTPATPSHGEDQGERTPTRRYVRTSAGFRSIQRLSRSGCSACPSSRLVRVAIHSRVSVRPVHVEFGGPWTALKAGESCGQAVGV